jgi:hypothetical protein
LAIFTPRSFFIRPHPEEGAIAPVSKDGAATWFETRGFAALLTMTPAEHHI